jgi:transcriptional regulator with XRE-family HTH domain
MGYTQDDVAYLLGLHSKTEISRWEKGTTVPLTDNVIRLAYIYHTFTEELFREYYKQVRYEIEPREKKVAQMRLKRNEKKKKRKY